MRIRNAESFASALHHSVIPISRHSLNLKMPRRRPRLHIHLFILLAIPFTSAWALRTGGMSTWKRTTTVGQDAEVPGWFINLGITGARALIDENKPAQLVIKYVFKDTPAWGILKENDIIIGANGKDFVTPHKFGYGVGKFGYQGPMMDFGNALEASQARLFKTLSLKVLRDGEETMVKIKLPKKYGKYSKTYPYNCDKTDLILEETYAYLLEKQKEDGTWHGRPHIQAFATLALMASGKTEYMPAVKKAVKAMAEMTGSKLTLGGLDCWKYGMFGAALAEYYLLTGEEWVLPELQEINSWIEQAQAPNGGWGHRPHMEEGNGYGAIQVITMQCKMAWALMMRCGIKVDEKRYQAAHEFADKGTNSIGYVWYKDGGKNNPNYADMGRTGASAIAHYLSPVGGKPYQDFSKLNASCIGNNPDTFHDTHGAPLLGLAWTGLGALADAGSFRKLMDHNRWYFSLSQCTDGTFYYQPNRDNNPQDYGADPRLSATAATSLILSVKFRKLQMTGADLVTRAVK